MTRTEEALNEIDSRLQDDLIKPLQESSLALSLFPDEPDAKWLIELGAIMWTDRPMLLVVKKGSVIPPKVEAAADEIIYYENAKDIPAALKSYLN